MEKQTLLQKIRSVKYCLMAHPHNEPDSEFADRIDDLQEIEDSLEAKVEQPVRKTLDEIIANGKFDKIKATDGAIWYSEKSMKDIAELYASQTKAVEPQEGWVDARNSKPEFDKSVLVFCPIWGRYLATYRQIDPEYRIGEWRDFNDKTCLPPTHYMPLPEPPTQTNN